MATDTEMPSNLQYTQIISVSDIRDHGSISFGRFAGESLAWEKWSVFSHNRCQEELEKFKAPGFVAQKKAYFEEYYRRYRAMKVSEADQQESTLTETHHKVQSDIVQVYINSNASGSSKGSKSHYVCQVQTLENDTSADSSTVVILDKPEEAGKDQPCYRNGDTEKICTIPATRNSLYAIQFELEHSMNEASLSPAPSMARNLEIGQHESPMKQCGHKTKEHFPASKKKGIAASDWKRTTLGNRTTQDDVDSSQQKKPSPRNKLTDKAYNSIVLCKSSTSKSERRSNCNHISSQLVGKCSGSTVQRTSLARNALVSSSSCRSGPTMTSANSKALQEKFPRRPHIQSVKNSTKEVVVSTCLIHKAGVDRNCVEMNDCQMKMRAHQPENQKPKAKCTNIAALNKSTREVGKGSYVIGRKHEQEKHQSNGSGSRDFKSMNVANSIHDIQKPFRNVVAKSKLTGPTHAQRETRLPSRLNKPSCR